MCMHICVLVYACVPVCVCIFFCMHSLCSYLIDGLIGAQAAGQTFAHAQQTKFTVLVQQ